MSKVSIEFRENSPLYLSPTKEVETNVAERIDVNEQFTVRNLGLILNPNIAPRILSTMNCVRTVGKRGRATLYERTYDPHEDSQARRNSTCSTCAHQVKIPICAILWNACYGSKAEKQ